MFGRKHFLLRIEPTLEKVLPRLLALIDGLIDDFDKSKAKLCIEYLSILKKVINSDAVLSDAQGTADTLQTIESMQHILNLLIEDAINDVILFCNNNQAFIKSWGMPSHFAVFRKTKH